MADRNEPGGGAVPSAFAELRRASRDDLSGLASYAAAILAIGLLIVLMVALA